VTGHGRLGLLVIDHGSRREAANGDLMAIAQELARLRPDCAVAHAHMELAAPDLATAFATLVAQGATRVHVLTYFLANGRHCREDIPRLAAEAAAHHPGVTVEVAPGLGPHPALALLLLLRAGLAQRSPQAPAGDAPA
jgi:sirohydrochlorin ferrochelatase